MRICDGCKEEKEAVYELRFHPFENNSMTLELASFGRLDLCEECARKIIVSLDVRGFFRGSRRASVTTALRIKKGIP